MIGNIYKNNQDKEFIVLEEMERKNKKQYYIVEFLISKIRREARKDHILIGRVKEANKDKIKFNTIYSSNNYGDYIPLKYGKRTEKHQYIIIRFIETGYEDEFTLCDVRNGRVKDIYFKGRLGIGSIGNHQMLIVDKELYQSLHHRWSSMLNRCYNVYDNKGYKNYGAKGFKVCNSWLCLENFINDVILLSGFNRDDIVNGELELDKDIINREAKIYSPETCIWVSKAINVQERNSRVNKFFIAKRLSDGFIYEGNNQREFARQYNLKKKVLEY